LADLRHRISATFFHVADFKTPEVGHLLPRGRAKTTFGEILDPELPHSVVVPYVYYRPPFSLFHLLAFRNFFFSSASPSVLELSQTRALKKVKKIARQERALEENEFKREALRMLTSLYC